jgi:hypothetical protein
MARFVFTKDITVLFVDIFLLKGIASCPSDISSLEKVFLHMLITQSRRYTWLKCWRERANMVLDSFVPELSASLHTTPDLHGGLATVAQAASLSSVLAPGSVSLRACPSIALPLSLDACASCHPLLFLHFLSA